ERKQLPEVMAALLDAYGQYFRTLTLACLRKQGNPEELEKCRLDARLARSNMEASVERYRAEPGASAAELDQIMSMLSSSHRFVHAAMSLEADLAANPSRRLPEGARRFFEAVDRTLSLLADVLRVSHKTERDFPDLRELHTQMLQNGPSEFALLNTET